MSEISESLRQAQAQHNALKANIQFEKNLSFFQQALPDIYQQYRNYQPKTVKPLIDENGDFNLVDIKTNTPLYPNEPEQYLHEAVDHYLKAPKFYTVDFSPKHGVNTEHDIHFKNHNAAVETFQTASNKERAFAADEAIPFMKIMGIGCGHHIPELIKRLNIQNLCIVEPSTDCFYASLYCIDWQAIAECFDREHTTINLILGKSPAEYLTQVKHYILQIGEFNAVRGYVFEHLISDEMKASFKIFKQQLPATLSMTGYFDDEQVSIAHTIANLKKRTPILTKQNKAPAIAAQKPVFIIANGPSLDKAKELILAQQNNVLIVSCGTALGSLQKMGIKPDIHIEMERTRPVYEWITASTSQEYRNDIALVALNTVHPDVFDLFPKNFMAMKSNDLGTHYAAKFAGQKKPFVDLRSCNPTVANAAMAVVTSLGLRKIYLFGLDLGFSPSGQHHSSHSKHYDIKKEHVASLNLYATDSKNTIKLPGNRGGMVLSNRIYAAASEMVSDVIRHTAGIDCHNASDGVLIDGAEPVEITDIPDFTPLDTKSAIVDTLIKRHFAGDVFKRAPSQQAVMSDFSVAPETTDRLIRLFSQKPATISEAQQLLITQNVILNELKSNPKTRHISGLLRGSSVQFSTLLARSLYVGESSEQAVAMFGKINEHYLAYLKEARERIGHKLLRQDARSRHISEKLESSN